MSNSQIFEPSKDDCEETALLKEELFAATSRYKSTLKNHSSENTVVCTFNFMTIQKQFNKVVNLKTEILKLVNHDMKFIEI